MKKKIYVCPNCGRALNFSEDAEFTFYCVDCGDYLHEYEAETEEQARMEGVVDYTDLARASMEIKAITEKAIQESEKQIEIKGEDIVEQIAEYINATIHPILSTGLYKDAVFRDNARISSHHFRIDFNEYSYYGNPYGAQLFGYNGMLRVYFNRNNEYVIEASKSYMLPWLVEEWPKLKDTMKRMIAYGLKKCDEVNQKRIEEQEALSNVINSFRL